MTKRVLIINEEFEPSKAFIDEYVNTPDALPNLLTNVLMDYDADLDMKRLKVYEVHPHLEAEDERESEITLDLLKQNKRDEAEDYQIQLVLDFINRYPQFRPLVSGVESQTSSIIKLILKTIREAFVGEF